MVYNAGQSGNSSRKISIMMTRLPGPLLRDDYSQMHVHVYQSENKTCDSNEFAPHSVPRANIHVDHLPCRGYRIFD
jgi:hypothetical protein